jgi:hypothetical protein
MEITVSDFKLLQDEMILLLSECKDLKVLKEVSDEYSKPKGFSCKVDVLRKHITGARYYDETDKNVQKIERMIKIAGKIKMKKAFDLRVIFEVVEP